MTDKIKPDVIYTRDSSGHYRIHADTSQLNREFEQVQEEMRDKFHTHQPNTPHYDLSPKEEAAQNYHSAMADALGKQSKGERQFVNGLPVNRDRSSQVYIAGAGSGLGETNPWVVILSGIAFLIVMFFVCRSSGAVHAAPEYIGSMPYPVDWNRQFVEIRWPDAPQTGENYYCTFLVQQQDGDAFVGITDSWLPYGDSVYLRMPFDFSGAKWFISELDCTIVWECGYQISPPNPGRYYYNGISQIILTLVTGVTK
jgi:hypothetical protein